ncbi:hypothetical protein GUITHDRAFT_113930 [Guillardia theta CCMP2712]|uniref:Uncharacterized protein n=1 Tax=Guillardia theta (strain CCMP2712) TaxID=905079 RepID=L1IUN0_GUITC|nr:hypothetical protein GUITHDRAFT_113930 [Guillardia theta CCMP2712]EKX39938.1 hypothetical protein GUITHDRAFT_113930 [Guillardia theta CCMP2712]|eukprot:XP_005826918.1 hypothetical protein GUITHDRAFT_113930 [Guillardia theta CCMP2712]
MSSKVETKNVDTSDLSQITIDKEEPACFFAFLVPKKAHVNFKGKDGMPYTIRMKLQDVQQVEQYLLEVMEDEQDRDLYR